MHKRDYRKTHVSPGHDAQTSFAQPAISSSIASPDFLTRFPSGRSLPANRLLQIRQALEAERPLPRMEPTRRRCSIAPPLCCSIIRCSTAHPALLGIRHFVGRAHRRVGRLLAAAVNPNCRSVAAVADGERDRGADHSLDCRDARLSHRLRRPVCQRRQHGQHRLLSCRTAGESGMRRAHQGHGRRTSARLLLKGNAHLDSKGRRHLQVLARIDPLDSRRQRNADRPSRLCESRFSETLTPATSRSWSIGNAGSRSAPAPLTRCRNWPHFAANSICGSMSTEPMGPLLPSCPMLPLRSAGLREADSIAVDPHKWLYARRSKPDAHWCAMRQSCATPLPIIRPTIISASKPSITLILGRRIRAGSGR